MAKPTLVVDLSHHQPDVDFHALKAGGIVGVILKATEGTTYVDDTFHARRSAAIEAGLCVSSYHFLKPGNYDDQMRHYVDTVQPPAGGRIVLDHEDPGVSLDNLKKCVEGFVGVEVTIYSGNLIKEQLGTKFDEFLAVRTSLWIAHYTGADKPKWPDRTWPAWSLWQFTDHATVKGIPTPVDGNRWNGSAENLVKWFGPSK